MKRLALVLVVALFSNVATAGPPELSGVVMRGTAPMFWVFMDAGLVVTLGGDPVDVCSNRFDELDLVAWQDMNVRDALRIARIVKGSDVRASVWDRSKFDDDEDLCPEFLSGQLLPLATGLVNFLYRDNDVYAFDDCESNENFDSFGFAFEGPLYSSDGRKRQFSGHWRAVLDCDTGRFVHDDTKLSLTK